VGRKFREELVEAEVVLRESPSLRLRSGPRPPLPIEAWGLLDGEGELREEVKAEECVEGWVCGYVGARA
jgi:hypothetical protein